jgi:hypothetical protein
VFEDCRIELAKSSEEVQNYTDQHRLESTSFEPGNLVMLNRKNIKTRHHAYNLKHKMYGLYEILDIFSPMAVCLRLPTMWNIHLVFHVSLIEAFVKGNKNVYLNAMLKTFHPMENAPKYDVDKVMGSRDKIEGFYT